MTFGMSRRRHPDFLGSGSVGLHGKARCGADSGLGKVRVGAHAIRGSEKGCSANIRFCGFRSLWQKRKLVTVPSHFRVGPIQAFRTLWLIPVYLPPVAHGTHDRAQIKSFLCEDVFRARRVLHVKATFDNAVLLERLQTV